MDTNTYESPVWLRRFSKLVCFSTLFLIFAGGMVTSTGSGLSVPDWPLSYGTFFPPMVGGVFYEHGHRMIAATIGFMTLCLAFCLHRFEKRGWVKKLGYFALGAVIAQGLLGGLTVLLFLPPPVSICHAILAQTFFILTIIIAYSQSIEREKRINENHPSTLLKTVLSLAIIVYTQLILGALMRHTQSGLAIYDFPTMGGTIIPTFDQSMLNNINAWRFEHDLPKVTMIQVIIHFIHRFWACIILINLFLLNVVGFKYLPIRHGARKTIHWLDVLVFIQICLGVLTVLTIKSPIITSFHVVTGAATLGMCVLLFLRLAPLTIHQTLEKLTS
jgi:cytochrome c oxidase assembly protein subunit 15